MPKSRHVEDGTAPMQMALSPGAKVSHSFIYFAVHLKGGTLLLSTLNLVNFKVYITLPTIVLNLDSTL